MTEIQVRPKADKRIAWQYCGQIPDMWPIWVRKCCFKGSQGMILTRASGRQVVDENDWLIKDLDGGIIWCRNADVWNEWEKV